MKVTQFVLRTVALSMLFTGALAQAATVTGTVTNKTTGKPAAGDTVVLVDVAAGMGEVAHAKTDAHGHYSLTEPGASSYLVRVTHQGAGYFIGAPQDGGPGDIPVYDVAAKVKGVFIEADVIEIETDNGQLKVNERYFVHNTSAPPVTQWSQRSFEIVLPAEAEVSSSGAQRPNGLPTSVKLDADGPKGHYAFNFPIQPDDGEKDTLFQISYTLPYSGGKYTFHSLVSLPADNFGILLPKSMTFTAGAGEDFKPAQGDTGVQTYLLKNAVPGKAVEFTVSGTGSIPHDTQNATGGQDANAAGSQPGGGIGAPINTPDPLSKYKWWILGALALLLAAAAAFLLRKPAGAAAPAAAPTAAAAAYPASAPAPATQHDLNSVLKEELFALESERIAGTIAPEEYAQAKAALEIVMKRALNKK
jgi:hypothetical protein